MNRVLYACDVGSVHAGTFAWARVEPDTLTLNAVTTDRPLNLVHGAALWAGWASDVERLHHACLVLKPAKPYGGAIDAA